MFTTIINWLNTTSRLRYRRIRYTNMGETILGNNRNTRNNPRFMTELTKAHQPWILLTGTLQERLDLAIRITDRLIKEKTTFIPPLG